MTISAVYTPAPGEEPEKLGPNEFTAGSELSLNCTVQGHSGNLTYAWSVMENPDTEDCYRCYISTHTTTSILTLGHPALYSYFAGTYTCSVSESGRPDSGNSDDFIVTVVGMIKFISTINRTILLCVFMQVLGCIIFLGTYVIMMVSVVLSLTIVL